MKEILVTGASGNLGGLTIEHLINKKHISPDRIVAMVRDKKRAKHLANIGVELRVGDYNDTDTLIKAFTGIKKLLVVSAPTLDNVERIKLQYNVVMAAKLAKIKHIFLVSIADADKRIFGLEDVDMATEYMIRAVDIPFTIMRNGVYLDEIVSDLKYAIEKGELVSATKSNGFNFVSRSDLALANATVLSEEGHENKIYNLVNSDLITYPEIASLLTEITGSKIEYREASEREVIKNLIDSGVSKDATELLVHSFQRNIAKGAFQSTSKDLIKLIGGVSVHKAISSIIESND